MRAHALKTERDAIQRLKPQSLYLANISLLSTGCHTERQLRGLHIRSTQRRSRSPVDRHDWLMCSIRRLNQEKKQGRRKNPNACPTQQLFPFPRRGRSENRHDSRNRKDSILHLANSGRIHETDASKLTMQFVLMPGQSMRNMRSGLASCHFRA